MEFINAIYAQILKLSVGSVPRIGAAVLVLVLGWLAVLIVTATVRAALRRLNLNQRISGWTQVSPGVAPIKAEEWLTRLVFYPLLLVVFVAFFQMLNLTLVTEPLNKMLGAVLEYAPRLAGAGLLLLAAWVLATVLRLLVSRLVAAGKLEERLSDSAGVEGATHGSLSKTAGEAAYWTVFLFTLPAILQVLQLQGLLSPVQGLLDRILVYLPNILAAAFIMVAGWFVARVLQRIVVNLLPALGADRLSERIGLSAVMGSQSLTKLIGIVVYVLILIPVVIAGLNALQLDAITAPASKMLGTIIAAFPKMLAATLLLFVAYAAGRIVSQLIARVLEAAGFNTLPARLGITTTDATPGRTPAEVTGTLLLVGIMLFASIEALNLLEYQTAAALMSRFLVFAGRVLLGLVIFLVGLYLANLAATAVKDTAAPQTGLLPMLTRVSIITLAGAMALRQMGLANEIITLAFGLVLGAIAVAAAIAFGIGGREIAASKIKEWVARLEQR